MRHTVESKKTTCSRRTFARTLANRLQNIPHQWFRSTFLSAHGEEYDTFSFLNSFEQRYMLSRHVQQYVKTQLFDPVWKAAPFPCHVVR
jgi:hypothetical protein